MSVLVSSIAFLVLLTLLVLIHEVGHFLAARKAGVTVEEFGIGLPPRATTLFQRGETVFSVNWIPFGGFVRLKGENAVDDRERRAPGSFSAASMPWRIIILVAGVFMNFLLAMMLLTFGFSWGRWIPTYVTFADMEAAAGRGEISMTVGVLIEDVLPDSPAALAGVPPRSILQSIDAHPVNRPDDVLELQEGRHRVEYTVLTGPDMDTPMTFTLRPREGKTGVVISAFARNVSAPKRGVGSAFILSLREARVMMEQTVKGLKDLVLSLARTGTVPDGITGIVGIAQLTHASVQEGFMTYLRLVALLSLSLAVLNILPFPALDGGRLLFVLAEFLGRRPVNRRFELATNALGFSILLAIIVLITFHDIALLFR